MYPEALAKICLPGTEAAEAVTLNSNFDKTRWCEVETPGSCSLRADPSPHMLMCFRVGSHNEDLRMIASWLSQKKRMSNYH